jgi:hypothetical protein
VGIADLGAVALNWQKGVPAGAGLMSLEVAMASFAAFDGIDMSAVPEPGTIGLLAVGALGLLARRRRN